MENGTDQVKEQKIESKVESQPTTMEENQPNTLEG
jgi:hypothetical protein